MLVDGISLKPPHLTMARSALLHSKVSHDESASHVQQGESSTARVQSSCKPILSMMSQSDLPLIS